MATYYTQDATGTKDGKATTYRFYGVQTGHDHNVAVAFSVGVKGVMKTIYTDDEIELGHFASNQSNIPTGDNVHQLYYNKTSKSWSNVKGARKRKRRKTKSAKRKTARAKTRRSKRAGATRTKAKRKRSKR